MPSYNQSAADSSTPTPTTNMPCSHSFHVDCIRPWIEEFGQLTCPLCRHQIATTSSPEVSSDTAIGILFGASGFFGLAGFVLLMLLIGQVSDSMTTDVVGGVQRVMLGIIITVFLTLAVTSFKLGQTARGGPQIDDDIDNDFGWVVGAADVMGITFQH